MDCRVKPGNDGGGCGTLVVSDPTGCSTAPALIEHAPAKINLTLHIVGRRADGYHELESFVAFAAIGDQVELIPGETLLLEVRGPFANSLGVTEDNLVLKAARELARRVEGLRLGRFMLTKRLPVASGIGGGSADAAAALRLLARANSVAPDDPRLFAAAAAVGADVPVCVDPRPRIMRGIGEILSAPIALPEFPAVLVNPGVPVETRAVFAALARERGAAGYAGQGDPMSLSGLSPAAVLDALAHGRNDLEPVAATIEPLVADVLAVLRTTSCRLARMSGSGATCFALFDSHDAAVEEARSVQAVRPTWWVQATAIG
jgi:4-diphosphocytidyl-2-C-methyl-D-erythritol kinase